MRTIIYYKLEKITYNKIGPLLRKIGQQVYNAGHKIQGPAAHEDYLVPSLRCVPISKSKFPKLLKSDWIAPNATVIGEVDLGKGSSLWHGTVARGDAGRIEIGKNTIIQDLTHLMSSTQKDDGLISIGDNVIIGVNCEIDSCIIESYTLIGNAAIIQKDCIIQSYSVVAAGSNLQPGTFVPTGQIWAGSPAKYLRDMTPEEKLIMAENHDELSQLARIYSEECEKNFREQVNHFDQLVKSEMSGVLDVLNEKMKEAGYPETEEDNNYMEHRVMTKLTGPYGNNMFNDDYYREKDSMSRGWEPYEQDLTNYPEVFKVYGEDYARYERVKERFENEPVDLEQGEDPYSRKLPWDQRPFTDQKVDQTIPRYSGTIQN